VDMAFCVEDSRLWLARELSDEAKKHPDEWLEKRRPTFICGGCEQKARFIDATKRNPHFGVVRGNDHDDDCDFLGNPAGNNNGAGVPLPDRAPAHGNKEIRYGKPGPLIPRRTGGNGGGRRNGGNSAAGNGPLQDTTKLQSLLKNLRNRPDYPPETLYLDVPARGPAVRATDYFYKIADVTGQTAHEGGTRAFWGVITNVTDDGDGGYMWINCDGKGHRLTTRVDPGLKAELYQLLGIERTWDLYEAHVIVEGVMGGSRKIRIDVTNLEKIAFLPKR
jgi:hypothetical protein